MTPVELQHLHDVVAKGDLIQKRLEALASISSLMNVEDQQTIELQPEMITVHPPDDESPPQTFNIDGDLYWEIHAALFEGLKKVEREQRKQFKELR